MQNPSHLRLPDGEPIRRNSPNTVDFDRTLPPQGQLALSTQQPDAVRTYRLPNGDYVHPNSPMADYDRNHPIEQETQHGENDIVPADVVRKIIQKILQKFLSYVEESFENQPEHTLELLSYDLSGPGFPSDRPHEFSNQQIIDTFIANLQQE